VKTHGKLPSMCQMLSQLEWRELLIDTEPTRNSSNDENTRTRESCRKCNKPIDLKAEMFPFCSNRCRLADLGSWFDESYKTSRQADADDYPDE